MSFLDITMYKQILFQSYVHLLVLGSRIIEPADSLKNPGVTLNADNSMVRHVASVLLCVLLLSSGTGASS